MEPITEPSQSLFSSTFISTRGKASATSQRDEIQASKCLLLSGRVLCGLLSPLGANIMKYYCIHFWSLDSWPSRVFHNHLFTIAKGALESHRSCQIPSFTKASILGWLPQCLVGIVPPLNIASTANKPTLSSYHCLSPQRLLHVSHLVLASGTQWNSTINILAFPTDFEGQCWISWSATPRTPLWYFVPSGCIFLVQVSTDKYQIETVGKLPQSISEGCLAQTQSFLRNVTNTNGHGDHSSWLLYSIMYENLHPLWWI